MNILKDRLIIAYGLNDEEIDKLNIKFKDICIKPCVSINDNMGEYTLEHILKEESLSDSDTKLPEEKVIIFNGFLGVYLQQAVKKVREVLGAKPILASTTPNSVKMTLHELIDHLVKERQYYQK
ncbi:DUF3783 domain-containing protein [Clostridium sulfidigenes]|uniref:DUF3783 domain-containing protein n=1 Tax=Clostridium sulfidigenes TaxID=318464 RepID=UPI003F8BA5FE